MNILVLVLINVLCLSASAQESEGKLKVSLYYEALCPFCYEFITEQLYPSYGKLASHLVIDLVPYGNAQKNKVNGTWHFECQHGPLECALNKLAGCGLAKTSDQEKQLKFVNCIESHCHSEDDEKTVADSCASTLGLTGSVILECSQSAEGSEILAGLGDKTDAVRPPIRGVPSIVFNDKNDETLSREAQLNFLATACKLLNNKPKACRGSNKIINAN